MGIGILTPTSKLDANGSIHLNGTITNTQTGSANLIPKAYGEVQGDAYIVSGTDNFTVTRMSAGVYRIAGNFHWGNVVIASKAKDTSTPKLVQSYIPFSFTINYFYVEIYKPDGTPSDGSFSFIVF